MGLREGGVGVRSGDTFGTSSACGLRAGFTAFKLFGSTYSPRFGRPSIFRACESRLFDEDPFPGEITKGVIVSKPPRFVGLSSLLIVPGCNRDFPGVSGAESLRRSFRLPSAKPNLRDLVLVTPRLTGEDPDGGLNSTTPLAQGKNRIHERRSGETRFQLTVVVISELFFFPLAKFERFLKNLDALA